MVDFFCAITDFFIMSAFKLSKNYKMSSGKRLALASAREQGE